MKPKCLRNVLLSSSCDIRSSLRNSGFSGLHACMHSCLHWWNMGSGQAAHPDGLPTQVLHCLYNRYVCKSVLNVSVYWSQWVKDRGSSVCPERNIANRCLNNTRAARNMYITLCVCSRNQIFYIRCVNWPFFATCLTLNQPNSSVFWVS